MVYRHSIKTQYTNSMSCNVPNTNVTKQYIIVHNLTYTYNIILYQYQKPYRSSITNTSTNQYNVLGESATVQTRTKPPTCTRELIYSEPTVAELSIWYRTSIELSFWLSSSSALRMSSMCCRVFSKCCFICCVSSCDSSSGFKSSRILLTSWFKVARVICVCVCVRE